MLYNYYIIICVCECGYQQVPPSQRLNALLKLSIVNEVEDSQMGGHITLDNFLSN